MGRQPPTHVDDPVAVGRRVREARERKGLSLRDVAFPGCSPSFLSRVEAGLRVPGLPVLRELSRRLGVPVEELAGRPTEGRVPQAQLDAAELAVRLGDPGAAGEVDQILTLARELRDRQGESAALEQLGHLAMAERDDARAARLFEEARSADGPVSARVRPALYVALGRAYAGTGDLARSVAVLGEAFEDARAEPADVRLMVRFGTAFANAYTDQGEFAQAEAVLGEVLRRDSEITDELSRVRAEWALARTYAEQGRSELAERYSRGVLARLELNEERETVGRAQLLLAGILLDQGRAADATEHLGAAEEIMRPTAARPELALVTAEQARAALMLGDLESADVLARGALAETESTEPAIAGSAYATLARAALARHDLDDARYLVLRAVDQLEGTVAPHYVAEAYDVLSRVEEEAGDLPAALQAARNAASRRQATRR
jgi:transcriptional regulator with XRE-family HTH domain